MDQVRLTFHTLPGRGLQETHMKLDSNTDLDPVQRICLSEGERWGKKNTAQTAEPRDPYVNMG